MRNSDFDSPIFAPVETSGLFSRGDKKTLPDFEMIQHQFLGGHDITIVPISDVQYADTLAHLKKNLLKSEEMMEEFDEGYSSEMRPMNGTMRGGSYRYDGGMSYARGDGRGRGRNAKRDSMGRYSSERGYSRDAADMTAELQDMMDDPKYAPVKHDIERLMRKVETM